MNSQSIISVKSLGVQNSIDIEVDHPKHDFILNNKIISSNSHAIAYSMLAAQTVYLKFNYPKEFFIECLRIAQNKPDRFHHVARIHQEMAQF